jgi:hypothetical protein
MDQQRKTGDERQAASETAAVHDPAFAAELERRLRVLESAGYEDPARSDLPTLDYYLLAALVIVSVVVAYAWGY